MEKVDAPVEKMVDAQMQLVRAAKVAAVLLDLEVNDVGDCCSFPSLLHCYGDGRTERYQAKVRNTASAVSFPSNSPTVGTCISTCMTASL